MITVRMLYSYYHSEINHKGEKIMKKKIMALCIASAMLVGAVPASYAAVPEEFIPLSRIALAREENKKVSVPTDIKLKKAGDTEYVNGPLSLYLTEAKSTSFDFRAEIAMKSVKDKMDEYVKFAKDGLGALGKSDEDIADAINSCYVKEGQFKITVTYPTSSSFVVPDVFKTNKDMYGVTSTKGTFANVFEETADRDTSTPGQIVITVDVKGGTDMTLEKLKANLDDLIITCEGVTINALGTYQVKGAVEGKTTIASGSEDLGDVTYIFEQGTESAVDVDGGSMNMSKDSAGADGEITGTVYVKNEYVDDSGDIGGVSGGSTVSKKTVTIVIGDGIDNKLFSYTVGTKLNVDNIPAPERPGYKFVGFYKDPELTTPLEGEITITNNMTIYTKWEEEGVNPPLDSETHFAYVIGYPTDDGSEIVRPEANITREEIATIYYRLLTDEVRDSLFTASNDFSDVAEDRWSNKAVSTMAKGGYVTGYEDGTFKPAGNITRAEFVTIAARFYNVTADSSVEKSALTDISGHWAEAYINYAVSQNWLGGYEDGTFRPDRAITRAEVMKIINNMLNRHVNAEGLIEGAVTWDDNSSDAWYYYDVIEATNAHTYDRAEGETYEKWTAITENKVWTEKPVYEDAQ
jgi:hypothetical protein